jgi:hypothetical protein
MAALLPLIKSLSNAAFTNGLSTSLRTNRVFLSMSSTAVRSLNVKQFGELLKNAGAC